MFKQFGFMAVVVVVINLAFWLGLIYGAFYIARHFGVL